MKANLSKYNQQFLFRADIVLDRLPPLSGPLKVCRDVIFPLFLDTDFEEMYKDGGRPPISPKLLMSLTILQFLERLPDRQTVQNLIYRIDWKMALGLEVDDPGVSYQVLSVWRQRLMEHDFARKIFDKVIEELKDRGLVKKGGRQRIDPNDAKKSGSLSEVALNFFFEFSISGHNQS